MTIQHEIAWGLIALACVLFFLSAFGIEAAIFSLLGILVLWWTWEYPEESFLTLIVLSALLPLLKVTQTLGNVTLIKDVIIITLFVRNFLFPLITQKLPYRKNALFAPLIALAAWACFEALRAGVTTLSILRLRDIGLYMMLYFAVLYLPHTASRMKIRLLTFFATLGITMVLGIFQFMYLPDSTVLRFDPARQIWIPRIASTFAHPTVFAEYLITGAMLIMGLILATKKKIFLSIFLLATTLLLYFTYTRAGWIGFAVGVVAITIVYILSLLRIQKPRSLALPITTTVVALSVIGILVFQFTPVGTFIRSGFDLNYASNADRIVFIIQLISQTSNTEAVIGQGLGNTITQTREGGDATAFDIASGESRTIQLSKDQTLVDNQYLKTFIEMGVVGVVLTFWLFWRFFLASKNLLRRTEVSSYALGIACIGFLAAFIVQALFVDIWDVYPTNAIFWTLVALASQGNTSAS
jgi:putative inorganic carbon (hco3(-)) transporter